MSGVFLAAPPLRISFPRILHPQQSFVGQPHTYILHQLLLSNRAAKMSPTLSPTTLQLPKQSSRPSSIESISSLTSTTRSISAASIQSINDTLTQRRQQQRRTSISSSKHLAIFEGFGIKGADEVGIMEPRPEEPVVWAAIGEVLDGEL